MALRFLADHCVPTYIVRVLRDEGHEVILLGDVLPVASADRIDLEKAQQLQAVLISLNGDFADIVAYPPRRFRGIIALQLHNRPEALPNLMKRLISYLTSNPAMKNYAGKLFVAEVDRIRIRE